MLYLLISLQLIVSPDPVKTDLSTPVKITVSTDDGRPVQGVKFIVKPSTLGKVKNGIFIPSSTGKGIILCMGMVDGRTLKKPVYLVINEEATGKITPRSARVGIGESVVFTVTGGNVKKWKVFPQTLGTIKQGNFTAKQPGRGKIVAVLEDGRVLTATVIVGNITGRIKVIPSFARVDVGGTVTLRTEKIIENPRWNVFPERVGDVNQNGVFTAKSPGRCMVVLRGRLNNREVIGRAVIVVRGGGVKLIPKRAVLKTGGTVKFTVFDGNGNPVNNIKWKVVPRRIGRISPDGMFTPLVRGGKGKVIAILPKGYSKRVLSAPVFIIPDRNAYIRVSPGFVHLDNPGQTVRFYTEIKGISMNERVKFSVYPEDLGTITEDGIFTAKREGTGVVIAKIKGNLPVKPGRAVVIVGEGGSILQVSPSNPTLKQGEKIRFIASPSSPLPSGIKFIWRVMPFYLGKIQNDGTFIAGKVPEGHTIMLGKVVVVGVKDGEICCYGGTSVTVRR